MANTGDVGGQCVAYVASYFKKRLGVDYAHQVWGASTVKQLTGPAFGSIACWKGGPSGHGHVGVVELWNTSNETMNFSDSNRRKDELVIKNLGITEKELLSKFPSLVFQGYVQFK